MFRKQLLKMHKKMHKPMNFITITPLLMHLCQTKIKTQTHWN